MKTQVMTREEVKNVIADVVQGVKLVCAITEMEAPGSKHVVLDVLIEELEVLDGREKLCAGVGACPDEAKVTCAPDAVYFDFGDAIRYLKDGKRVARKGWNGKNQYVELASYVSYIGSAGQVVNADHQAIGNKALAFVGTSGVQLGWLASQADMLAEDWVLV